MNSKKFLLLVLILFSFILANVFADPCGYNFSLENISITTIPGPEGYPPEAHNLFGENAYYGHGDHVILWGDTDDPYVAPFYYDWISLDFDLRNLSKTSDVFCSGRTVADFKLRINSDNITADFDFAAGEYVQYNVLPPNLYTTSAGTFGYNSIIHYEIPIPINRIYNTNGPKQVRAIEVLIYAEGSDSGVPAADGSGNPPFVEVYDPNYTVPEPGAVINDFYAYLDPISCCWAGTNEIVVPAPVVLNAYGQEVIRCDNNPLYDQNRICYEIKIKDVNALFADPLTPESYVKIESFSISSLLYSVFRSGSYDVYVDRIRHDNSGYSDFQYVNFPPTCDFMHYFYGGWPQPYHIWHTDCVINQSEVPKYSRPTAYTEILNCPDASNPWDPGYPPVGCSDLDQNVFYNTNNVFFYRYLDPDSFKLMAGDEAIISGNFKLARGGGNYTPSIASPITYSVYDSSGNVIRGPQYVYPFTSPSTNNRSYTATNYERKILKIGGHDAYVYDDSKFMPKSTFIRPQTNWEVLVPIKNDAFPWDGQRGIEDVLFVDVNIFSWDWGLASKMVSIGNNNYPADYALLDTDEQKVFSVPFNVTEGTYRTYISAAFMQTTLHDYKGWVFDRPSDKTVINSRLIQILNPVYEQGLINAVEKGYISFSGDPEDICYSMEYDSGCWYNYLPYSLGQIDLNSNADINFVLRLKNPFDFNEFFDLSYETNAPANARLEFYPETNFIAPFTADSYGYKYAKMVLKNPRILHGDANYIVYTKSENHPDVWDNLFVEFKTFSSNLKIESFELDPQKECYNINDLITFRLKIKNNSDKPLYGVKYSIVSETEPTVIWTGEIDIAEAATQEIFDTITVPRKGVYALEAKVEAVEFEFDTTDNDKLIYLTVCYEGDISKLPETNYLGLLFIILTVLFIVVKKK